MDIKCIVCGEPWFADLSDMAPWERDLFRKGAGCPSCEGQGNWQPETIGDIENGNGDLMDRLILSKMDPADRPKWEPPEPIVKWKCACCGIKAIIDPARDDYDPKDPRLDWQADECRTHGSASHLEWQFDRDHGEPDAEPSKVGDDPVCPECYAECDECGAPGYSDSGVVDPCDAGWLTIHPRDVGSYVRHPDMVCVNCLHEAEYEEAARLWGEASIEDRIWALRRAWGTGRDRELTIAQLIKARRDDLPSDDDGSLVEYFNTP